MLGKLKDEAMTGYRSVRTEQDVYDYAVTKADEGGRR